MRVILLILFILLIGQLLVNYFLIFKNVDKYQIQFIEKLHGKMIEKYNFIIQDIFQEFEELFEEYKERTESQNINQAAVQTVILILFMIASDAFLLIGVLLQTCRDCMKICRGVFSLIFLTFCGFLFIIYLSESITTKYKINFPDSRIYIYDEEFNKEIKEKLNMMVERKIYMLAFSIYLTLSLLAQYILIIVDIHLFKKKKKSNNNNINNTQPQMGVYLESEKEANNNQNNENEIQVHIIHNVVSSEQLSGKNN